LKVFVLKKGFAGEVSTGVWVQFDSPPKMPEGGTLTPQMIFGFTVVKVFINWVISFCGDA
jgi:hypothetical protein